MNWMDKIAMKQINELLNDPAHQAALKYFEEIERNPALKMLYKQMEEQARSPLFQISKNKMKEFDVLTAHEQLRTWEKHIPNWIQEAGLHHTRALDLVFGNYKEIEKLKTSLFGAGSRVQQIEDFNRVNWEAIQHLETSGFSGVRNWSGVLDLSRELSNLFHSLPSEARDTLLGQAARRLDAIRDSAENHDADRFEQEVQALANHLLTWVRNLVPHSLTAEGMFNIVLAIFLTLAQIGVAYEWRMDDQRESVRREQVQDEKLDAVLEALKELKENQNSDVGKQYQIERTSAVFARPGPKTPRVGYVYAGQRVRAVATTGRWIFIEYADPFNLELRAGWIRKKYAKYER
jgi:hypothetical protein